MTRIVFLRGINVSGKNLIPMASLREILTSVGFEKVVTYIQSGNILVDTKEENNQKTAARISQLIYDHLQLRVPAIALDAKALQAIIDNTPFPAESAEAQKKIYYMLLFSQPEKERVSELESLDFPGEELVIKPGIVYIRYEHGMGKAKCSTNFLERKLGVSATARNFRTMTKMLDLASSNR